MAARPTPINPNNEPFGPRNGDGPELHEPLIDWHATWRYLLHGDFFDQKHLTLPRALAQVFFWVFVLSLVSTVSALAVAAWFGIVGRAIP